MTLLAWVVLNKIDVCLHSIDKLIVLLLLVFLLSCNWTSPAVWLGLLNHSSIIGLIGGLSFKLFVVIQYFPELPHFLLMLLYVPAEFCSLLQLYRSVSSCAGVTFRSQRLPFRLPGVVSRNDFTLSCTSVQPTGQQR